VLPITASVLIAADTMTTFPEVRDGVQLETEEETEEPEEPMEEEAEETVDEVTEEEPAVTVVEDDDGVLGTGLLILLIGIIAVLVVGGLIIRSDRFRRP
jgi:hypothetical protein